MKARELPASASRVLARVAIGPFLIRGAAFVAGQAALLLSVPSWLRIPQLGFAMLVLAAVAAVFPATQWVSVLEYLAVGAWFATTTLHLYEVTPTRVLGLAVAIYLHHSACALAAVVPLDGVVAPRVLLEWTLRTGAVVAVSVPLGLLVLSLTGLFGRSDWVTVPVVGLTALVLAGLSLVWLARDTR